MNFKCLKNYNNIRRLAVLSLCFTACAFVCFQAIQFAWADTTSTVITIDAFVPSSTPSILLPPDMAPPTIGSVNITALQTEATISWEATDNIAVVSCSFQYGIGGLGSSAIPTQVGSTYTADLIGLLPGTIYDFQISCVDMTPNTGVYTDSFTTLDGTPPVISNIAATPAITSAEVSWEATDPSGISSCTFVFDTDDATEPYDNSGFVVDLGGGNYQTSLTGLSPNTAHYFKITCTDIGANIAAELGTFSTLSDTVPPPDVSGLMASPGDGYTALSWTYPPTVSDFSYYMVRRGSSPPSSITDGALAATISNIGQTNYTDGGLTNLSIYYYTVFVFDTSGNHSSGVSASVIPRVFNESAHCFDGIDNDLDGVSDCSDPDCVCLGPMEICDNGIDDNGNGLIDCLDPFCVMQPVCIGAIMFPISATTTVEFCTDGIDNDADTFIDCEDTDCFAHPACLIEKTQCQDGIDNDNDGLIDMADLGCLSPRDDSEADEAAFVGEVQKINVRDLSFWVAERTIETGLINGTLNALVEDHITIGLPRQALIDKSVEFIRLSVAGDSYNFILDQAGEWYYADFIAPRPGTHAASIDILYEQDIADRQSFSLQSYPYSVIRSRKTDEPLNNVQVILYDIDAGEIIWQADAYRQTNPFFTSSNGAFGFVVPNGTYRVEVIKEGYRTQKTKKIKVINNILYLSDGVRLFEEEQIIEQAIFTTVEAIQEFADEEQVEEVTKKVVAPGLVGLVVIAVVPSLWSFILPLLQFLFLQPLLLLGKRKRKEWGTVYNSLTKLSVDLAVVRLADAQTNKLLRTRVTDRQGRYMFMVGEGEYRLEVTKNGFNYPSQLLAGIKKDGRMIDIYHGEAINVTKENTVITPNIPLDPVGVTKTPKRIIFDKYVRSFQYILSSVGIIATAISLYITPTWYIGVFLAIHIAVYVGFVRHIKPAKAKGWGLVYDKATKKPIGKAIARLFSKEYNKLIATKITDTKGRYSFLVGPTECYITLEKADYKPYKSETISAGEVERTGIVKRDVGLEHT